MKKMNFSFIVTTSKQMYVECKKMVPSFDKTHWVSKTVFTVHHFFIFHSYKGVLQLNEDRWLWIQTETYLFDLVLGRAVCLTLYITSSYDLNEMLSGAFNQLNMFMKIMKLGNRIERNSFSLILWDEEYLFQSSDFLPDCCFTVSVSLCVCLSAWATWPNSVCLLLLWRRFLQVTRFWKQ